MIKKLLTLAIILIGTLGMSAQTISGTVNDLSGTAIANHTVNIMNNDSTNPYTSTAQTLSNGTYSFGNLPTSGLGYTLYTMNCQQQTQTQYVSSNSGTANFSICNTTASCVAYFSSSPDSSNTNMIHFNDASTGSPSNWAWSFGDGSTSSSQNPSHTYAANGTYTVTLSISGTSCSNSYSSSITIGNTTPTCQSAFYYVPDSTNANMILFFDYSTGNPTNWSWTFGDGTTSSLQNPSHTYVNGTYSVSLTISGTNCNSTSTQIITIGGSTGGCQAAYSHTTNGLMLSCTDLSTGGAYNWTWNFGDGNTSNNQNPTHIYASAGTYTVGLSILGNQNCQSNTSTIITVTTGSTSNYTISGHVVAASINVTAGTVELFNTINNTTVSTVNIDSSGIYNFNNIPAGTYLVKAIPTATSTVGQNFAATYYGDVVFWSAATPIVLSSNQSSMDISLVSLPANNGGGTISGNVGTGSKAGVGGLSIYLTDDNNSSALVASTTTNTNGDFVFNNIANGTYKIWVNSTGYANTPITVILATGSINSTLNDFIVKSNNTIIPKPTSINSNAIAGDMKLYPNPVVNTLNIELIVEQNRKYSFEIYSISGQLLSTEYVSINSGSNLIKINTNELSQGTYIIRIENSNNQTIQKLFVK